MKEELLIARIRNAYDKRNIFGNGNIGPGSLAVRRSTDEKSQLDEKSK